MISEAQFLGAKADMQSDADIVLIGMAMACTLLAGIDLVSRHLSYSRSAA